VYEDDDDGELLESVWHEIAGRFTRWGPALGAGRERLGTRGHWVSRWAKGLIKHGCQGHEHGNRHQCQECQGREILLEL
jgi:hypothetical protein